tara:strand:+ start:6227 stop:6454 length:228 start_codon:yes stop_codon:yes gene_type:complete
LGFHKRYINNNQVIEMYKAYGIQKVCEWYTKGCDAVITEDGLATDINDLIITLKEKENLVSLSNLIDYHINFPKQ